MMQSIEALIQKPEFIGKKLQYEGKEYVVKQADNYSYTDPVDNSKATKQVCSDDYDLTNFQAIITSFCIVFCIRVYEYCSWMVRALYSAYPEREVQALLSVCISIVMKMIQLLSRKTHNWC